MKGIIERKNFYTILYRNCEPGGQIEIRQLPSEKRFFIGVDEAATVDYTETENIYFGVATRDGKGGKKENIVEIPAVWCDADFKITPQPEVEKRLSAFPLKPTLSISSGGGFHFYWRLKEPSTQADIPRVETINRRIVAYLGGDAGAVDAARVLRVPGTLNHKYNPPRRCTLTTYNPAAEYNLEDFEELLPEIEAAPQPEAKRPAGAGIDTVCKCDFLRWCHENPANVSEPLWFAMVSNVARLSPGGPDLVHSLSRGYPKYSKKETDEKILHALNGSNPHTCEFIRKNGFDCPKSCKVRSPAGLFSRVEANTRSDSKTAVSVAALSMGDLSKMFSSNTEMLVDGLIPAGLPSMLAGDPGVGKTTIAVKLAQLILDRYQDKTVFWVATEGTAKDTYVKAVEMGLDRYDRFLFPAKDGGDFVFNFQKEVERKMLDDLLSAAEFPPVAVFIDSIRGMSAQSANDEEVGHIMRQLNAIVCDKHGAALNYLHHFNKKTEGSLMNRITGSGALVAAVRLAIAVIPNSKLSRKLVFAKNNLGIDEKQCLVTKQGNDLEIYHDQPEDFDDTKTGEAERFLLDLFKNSADVLARDIYREGESKGFSDSLLKRAKNSLGIKARQTKDGWVWRR